MSVYRIRFPDMEEAARGIFGPVATATKPLEFTITFEADDDEAAIAVARGADNVVVLERGDGSVVRIAQ